MYWTLRVNSCNDKNILPPTTSYLKNSQAQYHRAVNCLFQCNCKCSCFLLLKNEIILSNINFKTHLHHLFEMDLFIVESKTEFITFSLLFWSHINTKFSSPRFSKYGSFRLKSLREVVVCFWYNLLRFLIPKLGFLELQLLIFFFFFFSFFHNFFLSFWFHILLVSFKLFISFLLNETS